MSETKSVYDTYKGNTYLFEGNAPYVEEMYEKYLENPMTLGRRAMHSSVQKMAVL